MLRQSTLLSLLALFLVDKFISPPTCQKFNEKTFSIAGKSEMNSFEVKKKKLNRQRLNR